jgi:hypothetical protein
MTVYIPMLVKHYLQKVKMCGVTVHSWILRTEAQHLLNNSMMHSAERLRAPQALIQVMLLASVSLAQDWWIEILGE